MTDRERMSDERLAVLNARSDSDGCELIREIYALKAELSEAQGLEFALREQVKDRNVTLDKILDSLRILKAELREKDEAYVVLLENKRLQEHRLTESLEHYRAEVARLKAELREKTERLRSTYENEQRWIQAHAELSTKHEDLKAEVREKDERIKNLEQWRIDHSEIAQDSHDDQQRQINELEAEVARLRGALEGRTH